LSISIIVKQVRCGIRWQSTGLRGGVIAAARIEAGGGELPPELATGLGYLLARAGGQAIRELNRGLQPLGMRTRHHTVLLVAADSGGRSQRELGEVLGIDPSAVVALVDDLERDGLVRRDPHPDDRRTRLVVATEAGRARLAQTLALARTVDEDLLSELTPAERDTVLRLLRRIAP
jgi:MarR family transcriptional regulator, lower aerobic nicotinate degradation pathway regulator